MARTSNVFACVEPEIKEQAEQVLDRLGIFDVKCGWDVFKAGRASARHTV